MFPLHSVLASLGESMLPLVGTASRRSLVVHGLRKRTRARTEFGLGAQCPRRRWGSGEAGGGVEKIFRPNTRPPPQRYKRPHRRPESASQTAQRGRGSRLAPRPKRPTQRGDTTLSRATEGPSEADSEKWYKQMASGTRPRQSRRNARTQSVRRRARACGPIGARRPNGR